MLQGGRSLADGGNARGGAIRIAAPFPESLARQNQAKAGCMGVVALVVVIALALSPL